MAFNNLITLKDFVRFKGNAYIHVSKDPFRFLDLLVVAAELWDLNEEMIKMKASS